MDFLLLPKFSGCRQLYGMYTHFKLGRREELAEHVCFILSQFSQKKITPVSRDE
jgi:hypothetical protein